MPTNNALQCAQHGDAFVTYVCKHLVDQPRQRWYCDYPSEDNRWPDAWCQQCDEAFQKEGEWNEKNENATDIKIICNSCYEERLASSLEFLEQDVLQAWNAVVTDCHEELCAKQDALETLFSLSKHKRWDYDQSTGLLTFSNNGIPAVIADVEFIGSYSTVSETWLWSWSNFHLLENVRTRIKAVREYGEHRAFPRLTIPKWPADEVHGWEVSAVATHVLSAKGVYRAPTENGFLFMAIMEVGRSS
ncbi:MAG: hypothetical protein HY081_08975 [Gammaproteobacteria bacterium]|nr:hypothetical protein [Gammaproteobacteria bacterium]